MSTDRQGVCVAAPAKINFGLRILGLRSDGYHEIDSLFLPLDLADEIRVSKIPGADGSAPEVEFSLRFADELGPTSREVPEDRDNLAVRAARAFAEATGISYKLRISLTKRIPAAAGLGGGSSDGAAVLRALAEIYPGALSDRELKDVALRLGADVPYFLDPRPAKVGGIGERIEARRVPSLTLLLANPGIPLSTAEVFRAWDAVPATRSAGSLTRPAADSTMRPPDGRVDLSVKSAANDLEAVAVGLCPAIASLREELVAAGASEVGMSGSGPTVFGVFESLKSAEKASGALTEVDRGQAEESAGLQRGPIWARVATTLHSL